MSSLRALVGEAFHEPTKHALKQFSLVMDRSWAAQAPVAGLQCAGAAICTAWRSCLLVHIGFYGNYEGASWGHYEVKVHVSHLQVLSKMSVDA
jgi:hypothetical protein